MRTTQIREGWNLDAGVWARLIMKEQISNKQLREFGIVIGFGFPILIGWLLPLIFGHDFRAWTLWIGIPGFIIGLMAPRLLRYPYRCWMAIGHVLGWVNSHIILGLVFIIVLLPIAYTMRLTGYDPLRKIRKGDKSYRENRHDYQTDLSRIFWPWNHFSILLKTSGIF